MIFLLRLVTKSIWFIPADISSSTTLCTMGSLPTGKISFGSTLVVGNSLVRMPAIGTIAFVIAILNVPPFGSYPNFRFNAQVDKAFRSRYHTDNF